MEGSVRFLDGSQILQALSAGEDDKIQALFQEAIRISPTPQLDAAQCRAAAISFICDPMCGVPLPDHLLDRALMAAQFPPDLTTSMDQASFSSKLQDLLQCIAAALKEKPMVVSILDGAGIKSILEDEDDFAMLAENLFTELDVEDTGKISPSTLRTALLRMGSAEMGVPDPSASEEAERLISSILEKHKSKGQESIGQAQFAKLLQGSLEDLADGLAHKPVAVKLDLNVNNGSQLKKMLADAELFSKVADKMFDDFDTSKDGKLNKSELRRALESHGEEWGLPTRNSSEHIAQLYNDLFSVCDSDNSGEIDKKEFQSLLQEILEVFADKLESNPIFMS